MPSLRCLATTASCAHDMAAPPTLAQLFGLLALLTPPTPCLLPPRVRHAMRACWTAASAACRSRVLVLPQRSSCERRGTAARSFAAESPSEAPAPITSTTNAFIKHCVKLRTSRCAQHATPLQRSPPDTM